VKIAAVSVRGKDHQHSGLPCQDYSLARTSSDGAWSIVVIADGAGSAKYSDYGAEYSVKAFADTLDQIACNLADRPPGSWLTDEVIRATLAIRDHYRDRLGEGDIGQYASTMLGALVGTTGGFVLHIGDGAAVGSVTRNGRSSIEVLSKPENGEYANETYFVTSTDWLKRLRITPLPDVDWIVLGTDGGTALMLADEKSVKSGFVDPFVRRVSGIQSADLEQEIRTILSDDKADRLTGDDKTLAIAWKRAHFSVETAARVSPQREIAADGEVTKSQSLPSVNRNTAERSEESFIADELEEHSNSSSSWLMVALLLAFVIAIFAVVAAVIYRHDLISSFGGNNSSERREIPASSSAPERAPVSPPAQLKNTPVEKSAESTNEVREAAVLGGEKPRERR